MVSNSSSVGVGNGVVVCVTGEDGVTKSVAVGVVAVAAPDNAVDVEAFGVDAVVEDVVEAVADSVVDTIVEAVSAPVVETISESW